ncbi:DMT family transporter [Winogradskyella thalassocola]|uniref:EamA domain-containing membrane protein RarD n=1 Tax=Winogradskyella thalassocola TaxID=262004 RepID=A0A1G7XG49_9FLAO|nr:EamA family transporter [Winogradskyella thalassocola]SDG83084.1 EamA domain-containing membrane protein RarD [Winogradskyella thalassocola]
MKNLNLKWIYLLILSIIWGSSFILIKKSLLGLTAFQLGALRTIITGILLLGFGFNTLKAIPKSKWKWLLLSGLLGSFIPSFFFAIAETEIDSAVTSILNSLVPLNTILLGFAIFRITSTKRQIFGVAVGFIGTAILILKGSELNPNQNYLYAAFVIASTVMYAANVNIIKRYLQDVKPLAIAAGNYALIIIPALIVLLFSDFFTRQTFNNPNLLSALLYVTILSVFGTAIAKVLYFKLVQMSTPVFASSVTYMMPIIALIWGVLDGEHFSLIQGLAAILILIGVYLSHKSNSKLN